MIFDSELKQMENGIANIVDETLSNISQNFDDIDYVLDDIDGSFKNYFLERAGSRLSSSYSAFVIKARANKRNRNATIEILDDDSNGSKSTIDETLYKMKQEVPDNQKNLKLQAHFELMKSPNSDVRTMSTIETVTIKKEIIENSTEKDVTQSNTESTSSFPADADANIVIPIKSENKEEPKGTCVNEIKIPEIVEPPKTKGGASNNLIMKTRIPQPNVLIFYCVHCQEESVTSESFESVHEIHNHWLLMHAKLFQPFRFYAGLQCVCYLCKKTGSFKEIFNHFIIRHPGRPIGITKCLNENKCAICDFIGDNIPDHFQLKHPITAYADVFNPIRFSKDFLRELNTVVHKKFKCRCCDDQFETESQIIDHYTKSINHNLQKYPYEDFIPFQPPSHQCGLCKSVLEQKEIENHLKNHEINCTNCSTFVGTICELEMHHRLEHSNASIDKIKADFLKGILATKIIQSNGLVLNRSNLLMTTDDEYTMLLTLFERFKPSETESNSPVSVKTSRRSYVNALDHKTKSLSIKNLPKIHRKRNVDPKSEAASSFHHSRRDLSDEEKQKYLARQKQLLNNLYISGLPESDGKREVLMDMFKKLCVYIKVSIEDDDITSIQKAYFNRNDIIVEFKDESKSKRELILMKVDCMKILHSDDFLRLKPGLRPKHVCVMPQMTKHYERLTKNAKKHIRKGLLFNARISDRGLAVKVSENCMEEYVNSSCELDIYVYDNDKHISALNTPKRGKFG